MIATWLGLSKNLSHRRRIVVLDSTAQGERQEFFRERLGEELWTPEQGLFEASHTVDIS